MNDQNQLNSTTNPSQTETNQTPVQATPSVPESSTPPSPTPVTKYNLKKIVIICAGVVLILVVLATIFSLFKKQKPVAELPEATAIPTAPLTLTDESKSNDSKLKVEKQEIQQIDIYQKYLTPPTLKFDISF